MERIASLEKYLDVSTKFFGVASRLGIVGGGLAFLAYCYRIQYFPEGVTAGDTLALIFISVSFCALYLLFSASLYALGVTLYPVWKLKNWALGLYNRLSRKDVTIIEYIKPDLSLVGLSLFGVLIIAFAGLSTPTSMITLLLCCWGLAVMAATHKKATIKLSEIQSEINSPLSQLSDIQKEEYEKDQKHYISARYKIAGFALLIPLLLGGMSGKILLGSISALSIKSEGVIIHVKKPYGALIESYGLTASPKSIGKEYMAFENTSILLRGIGKNTVVAPIPENTDINVAIPNDSIVVQKVNKNIKPTQ